MPSTRIVYASACTVYVGGNASLLHVCSSALSAATRKCSVLVVPVELEKSPEKGCDGKRYNQTSLTSFMAPPVKDCGSHSGNMVTSSCSTSRKAMQLIGNLSKWKSGSPGSKEVKLSSNNVAIQAQTVPEDTTTTRLDVSSGFPTKNVCRKRTRKESPLALREKKPKLMEDADQSSHCPDVSMEVVAEQCKDSSGSSFEVSDKQKAVGFFGVGGDVGECSDQTVTSVVRVEGALSSETSTNVQEGSLDVLGGRGSVECEQASTSVESPLVHTVGSSVEQTSTSAECPVSVLEQSSASVESSLAHTAKSVGTQAATSSECPLSVCEQSSTSVDGSLSHAVERASTSMESSATTQTSIDELALTSTVEPECSKSSTTCSVRVVEGSLGDHSEHTPTSRMGAAYTGGSTVEQPLSTGEEHNSSLVEVKGLQRIIANKGSVRCNFQHDLDELLAERGLHFNHVRKLSCTSMPYDMYMCTYVL